MGCAGVQEALELDTDGCQELFFPKPYPPYSPPCCWKKPPSEDEDVAVAFNAGIVWLLVADVVRAEVVPTV
jgi:hypothetical protein